MKVPLFALVWDWIEISKLELKDEVRNNGVEDKVLLDCVYKVTSDDFANVDVWCWKVLMLLVSVRLCEGKLDDNKEEKSKFVISLVLVTLCNVGESASDVQLLLTIVEV